MTKKQTKQTEEQPITLTEGQFFKHMNRFREQCYKSYCPDCKYKGKNHAIITCFEKYMQEVFKNGRD